MRMFCTICTSLGFDSIPAWPGVAVLVWERYICFFFNWNTDWVVSYNKVRPTWSLGIKHKIKRGHPVTCTHPLCNLPSLQGANTNWWSHFWSDSNYVCVQAERLSLSNSVSAFTNWPNKPTKTTTKKTITQKSKRKQHCRQQEPEDRCCGSTFRKHNPVTDQ